MIKRKIYVLGKIVYIWQNFKLVLTFGRYVGLSDDEDDFVFKKRFTALKAELEAQLKEEAELNRINVDNLLIIKLPND